VIDPHHLLASFFHPLQNQSLLGVVNFVIKRTPLAVVRCKSVQDSAITASQDPARLDGFLIQTVLDNALQ